MLIMFIMLSTAIGTVTGVIATVLLMQRKGKFLASGADLTARMQIPKLEADLAAATAEMEQLRKVVEAQGATVQESRNELEKESALRAAAEQRSADFESRAAALSTQAAELAATLEEQRRVVEEAGRRIPELEAELANERHNRQGWSERLEGLCAQVAELEAVRAALDEQLRKERQSAAEGMQLLQLVQSKLSGVVPSPNGNANGHAPAVPEPVDHNQNGVFPFEDVAKPVEHAEDEVFSFEAVTVAANGVGQQSA